MGVDLMLLPMTVDYDGMTAVAYTTLELERRHELWPLVRTLSMEPVPAFFETLLSPEGPEESWAAGNTQTDSYGSPLRCVLAEDLYSLADHPAVQGNHTNRAVWAYLAQLPAGMRVALYWW